MTRYSARSSKNYTLALLLVAMAAMIVCAAARTFKRDAALMVQNRAEQSHMEYYSLNGTASQENTGRETNGAAAVRAKRAGNTQQTNASVGQASSRQESASSKEKEETFLIKVHDGKIGVFQAGEKSPFLTADVEVYLLPTADQSILKKGIRAESFSEVKRILEDYQ